MAKASLASFPLYTGVAVDSLHETVVFSFSNLVALYPHRLLRRMCILRVHIQRKVVACAVVWLVFIICV